MEKKQPIKVSLPMFISVLVLLIACIFGIYMYMQNQNLEKEITRLREEMNQSQITKNELQEKLNIESNSVSNTEKNEENKDVSNRNKEMFNGEQVKQCLTNYLELKETIGDELLIKLTQKGVLNYNKADNTVNNYVTTTKIKYSDYKKAMLNYVSEKEFEKNWTSHDFQLVDTNGYIKYGDLGGATSEYTILNITKTGETTYTAKTTYTVREDTQSTYNEELDFTVKDYNGHCVIDSINKE